MNYREKCENSRLGFVYIETMLYSEQPFYIHVLCDTLFLSDFIARIATGSPALYLPVAQILGNTFAPLLYAQIFVVSQFIQLTAKISCCNHSWICYNHIIITLSNLFET